LNKDEVERLKQEAALHAEEDKKKKELVEAKNQAESMIYLVEKTIRENGEKIHQEAKDSLTAKVEKLKSVKESDNIAEIQSAISEVSQALQDIGKGLYNK
jgi:molecular chaperone DnaK